MNRFSKLAAALAVLPIMAFASPVLADSPGQIEGASDIIVAKNMTQNGAYSTNISTACGDEVQYSTRLHNINFGGLSNIKVSVNLLSGKMTAVPDQGADWGATGSVKVNLPTNGDINFEAGTTTLFDHNGSVIRTLSDGITTVGVNIGGLNGSTTEFVNFKAKVNCPPVTPPVVSFACTELDVTNIDRTHYDFTAKASVSNATVTSYGFTAKDANGNTVDTNTVTTNALSALYHFNQSNAGTYGVSAVVNTDHGSTSASACSKQITVAAVPTTPATPAATALPNTGAGDVLGIFGGASAFGTAGHYLVSRRRRGL